MEKRSWAAAAAGALGVLGLVDAGLGPGLANLGILTPMRGFFLFGLGLLASLLAILVGLVALLRTRPGSGRSGRSLAWLGMACGAAVLTAVAALGGPPDRDVPRINDITTRPDSPPEFVAAARDPANEGRDLSYPPGNAEIQRAAYPDLEPLLFEEPVEAVQERARAVMEELGWEIVEVRAGAIEARDTSGLFRFVDDIVVRIAPARGGTRVDIRSKSRDGKSDLGVNAERIRAFSEALRDG